MSDHDPMLDGITRFGLRGLPGYPTDDVVVVVPFSDLPALLAKVREDAVRDYAEAHYANKMQRGEERYEQGQRDEREACIAAVRDTPTDPRWNVMQVERAFIAVIRARGEAGE